MLLERPLDNLSAGASKASFKFGTSNDDDPTIDSEDPPTSTTQKQADSVSPVVNGEASHSVTGPAM